MTPDTAMDSANGDQNIDTNMIENGATTMELVYQLGHLNQGTVMQYYAEVKSARLAEMNTRFFKEQFHLLLSNEQLITFPEEERRLLYVDFRLGKRRVEYQKSWTVKKQKESSNALKVVVHSRNRY